MRNIQSFPPPLAAPALQKGFGLSAASVSDGGGPVKPMAKALLPNQPPPPDPNDYKNKLLNLIPAEVVAAYVFIEGIIQSSNIDLGTLNTIQWSVFAALFIINPIYLFKVSGVNNKLQLFFSTLAFAVWVLALVGGPFETLGNKVLIHLLGSIVLAIYTLLIPIFVKPVPIK